jgi:type IV pilus assembly protein PilQ
MRTTLRLALLAVSASLLSTLAWMARGDQAGLPLLRTGAAAWIHSLAAGPTGKPDRPAARRSAPRITLRTVADPNAEPFERTLSPQPGGDRAAQLPSGYALVRQSQFEESPPSGGATGKEASRANPSGDSPGATSTHALGSNGADSFDLVVRNKEIAYVLDLLNNHSGRRLIASKNVKGVITLSLYGTTVEKALATIVKMQGLVLKDEGDVTWVYTVQDLEEVEARGIDTMWVYRPKYISAADLMGILTPMLSEDPPGKISANKANVVGIAANKDQAGGDAYAVPDVIVVRDTPKAIERIKRIVTEIDVRPRQVLIEAILISVLLDNEHQMGVNFAALEAGHLAVSGNGTTLNISTGFRPRHLVNPDGTVHGGFADTQHGLKYGVIRGEFNVFFNFLETFGTTSVVASPSVLALNKQRAEIQIGQQLGYRTLVSTETSTVENIQFLDVGTQLRMRPFILPGDLIRMELHPEKSTGRVSETTGLPEKSTTEVTTNLTIQSGTTIVIGGLIEELQQRQVQQIPFLGSLPLVGPVFRDETTTTSRQELIVMITPRIVDEDEEAAAARHDMEQWETRRNNLECSFPRHTRLGLARKYYEKACAFRAEGDMVKAAQCVQLCLHFDPIHEPALQLRDELKTATGGLTDSPTEPKSRYRTSNNE